MGKSAEFSPFQRAGEINLGTGFAIADGRYIRLPRVGRSWPTNPGFDYRATLFEAISEDLSILRLQIDPNSYLPPETLVREGKTVVDYPYGGSGKVIYQQPQESPTSRIPGRLHTAEYPSETYPDLKVIIMPGSRFAWRAADNGLEILRVVSPPLEAGDFEGIDMSAFDSASDNFRIAFRRLASVKIGEEIVSDYYTDPYGDALRQLQSRPHDET